METIRLPESELSEMKQFYQEEQERLSRRLQHIKTILGRLGVEQIESKSFTGQEDSLADEGTGSSPSSPKRKMKRGRKPIWEMLIMKRLRQLDKPVTYDQLTDEILTFSKLPENKRKSTKQAIINVVFRLRSQEKKLDTFSMGSKVKYIALKSWFEKTGEIKKEYAAKIPKTKSKSKSF